MHGSLTPLSVLGPQAEDERQRIRQQFDAGGSAQETLQALCALADKTAQQIFGEVLRVHSTEPQELSLVALGGYGRRLLFPYSDLDILFLFGNEKAEAKFRPLIADFSRTLWDLGFRVSSAGRTLEECKRIEEDNAEFHLALLDRRFLAGDEELFIACQKPAVQKREMKFGIVFFDAFAFLKRAAGGAHAKTEIPQRSREIRNQRTKFGLGFFVAE